MARMRLLTINLLCLAFMALAAAEGAFEDDQVPLTKFGSGTGPTLKFYYCYSCGYRRVYEEYIGILKQKYPELHITGENYHPPGYNMYIAKFLGVAKIVLIVMILSGVNVFQYFGQQQPSWWQWCIDNRIYACVMLFFASNAIEGQLVSSGAFEILLNDVPVWSKLETGRIPQPPELFQIIDNHMMMSDETKINFDK